MNAFVRPLPYPHFPLAFLTCAFIPAVVAPGAAGAAAPVSVYIGTVTGPESASKGIYLCHLDPETGTLTLKELAAEAERPGFLAVHPNRRRLYVTTATARFREQGHGGVAAFAIEDSGRLRLLNEESSMGLGPTHVSIDASGRTVLVANYGDGSVASFPVSPDGRLGPAASVHRHAGSSVHPRRQAGPHAHSLYAAPGGRFAVGGDLGTDKIMIYRLDAAAGRLEPNDPPSVSTAPGAGPRHLAFHPDGRRLFALNELNGTLALLSWDGTSGRLEELATVPTLPAGFEGENTTAEVAVHPSGRFVYASNRGHDSIALFRYDAQTDVLAPAGHEPTGGAHPRHFSLDPSGRWLVVANRDSDNLVVFGVDAETGELRANGASVSVPRPVCVRFVPPAGGR